jgi:Flp pilus assembly protein TadD
MLIRIGRVEEGLGILETIKSGGPLYLQAQLAIATAEANIGRDEEAELRLSQLATALPASSTPFIALGDHFRERQNYARAVDAYDAAFARIGKPQKRHWLLYFARGAALERLDRWAQAQSDLDLALALNPDEAIVLNYLGYSLLDRKLELARARRLIEQAASVQPNDGYIIDSLGWAYYRSGEIKRAVEVLERAVQLKPQDSTINDHLGDAYWRADRKLEARFQWTHALTFKPEPDQEALLKRKLEVGLDLAEKATAAIKENVPDRAKP